jgi:ClpP class serine protease
MTEVPLGELGPVDYVIVEFPAGASSFTGEMATELSDIDELGELQTIEAELAELLAEEDVDHLAAAMAPGSSAGVLIWENLWAAPFASAARRSGGQLIADGRIPIQAIIASIEADETTATAGD